MSNPVLHQHLRKERNEISRDDLIKIIKEFEICQMSFLYSGLDGKIKELKIPTHDRKYADMVLAQGERIDGSSIFKGVIDTGNSDLYIVPIYKTAFFHPFEQNTLAVFCNFLDRSGELCMAVPENVLARTAANFRERTKLNLNALGELEFYLIYDPTILTDVPSEYKSAASKIFMGKSQRNYHQSYPYNKQAMILNSMLSLISSITGAVKYAHAEVGCIEGLKSNLAEINGKNCEQFEIEFLPRPIEDMAHYLNLAKWIIRTVAYRFGSVATFTPKIQDGHAGTGMHVHLELTTLTTPAQNVMVNRHSGKLSEESLALIGGLAQMAPSLTAFGNTVASSYWRLVANQEAPTRICWSEQNRSALIRVPLGWSNLGNLAEKVNDLSVRTETPTHASSRQTVELRSPDGSAMITLLLAGICAAAEHGLCNREQSLELAKKLHVTGNIFNNGDYLHSLPSLPASCQESAEVLQRDRGIYERAGIPTKTIDYLIQHLKEEATLFTRDHLQKLSTEEQKKFTRDILHKDLHAQ
ncbi:MAG: glutamine synthetase beta-grasp domain-containing protein [Oligoflexia bacterium]|nr:glutamine synthetase beta-grasp domain-containing protein [Oligoflexia bacterium]MBF0364423.1 glutamine synthetase beta-grasp domain-containing protein [Oligoflexia bacterium]